MIWLVMTTCIPLSSVFCINNTFVHTGIGEGMERMASYKADVCSGRRSV